MPLQLKDLAKLNQIIERVQAGRFDANDVDNLLIRLRPYGEDRQIFLEIAHFVAHPDARDRGLAQDSLTAFVDSIRFFQEYAAEARPLNLSVPFPSYVHRLFLSQAKLADEQRLRTEYRMGHATLIKKIKASFVVDEKTRTCTLANGDVGAELFAALQFVTGFIHSRPAFHLDDFHRELKELMRMQKVSFDEAAWDAQADRLSLAILCLVSNTQFRLKSGGQARCELATENEFRVLSGYRSMPDGGTSGVPIAFGRLMIRGHATVERANKTPLQIAFPLIQSRLDPHAHCDPALLVRKLVGDCEVEVIDLAPDMSLSGDFRLVRSDSLLR